MKTLPLLLALVALNGCVSAAKITRELGKDPSTVNLNVTTIYGTVKLQRTNIGTNSTVTISPDGTLKVQRQ